MKIQALALLSVAATPALSDILRPAGSSQHVVGDVFSGDAFTGNAVSDGFTCSLPPAVAPASDSLPSAEELFSGPKALSRQVHRHAAIVSVPTISYDDMDDVDKDPRWAVFHDLHRVLEQLFPAVYARANVTKVNTFGLVFYIEGSNASLKPLMLTAHQDVVPVPDPSAWVYPPFSGHYDGAWLWGRGSVDDKSSLTAIMSVMETMLANDTWTPRRSIVLAFGFDEECSGHRGAGKIATYLEETFGRDSMVLILDEGGSGLELVTEDGGNTLYALPSVVEKSYVDIYYELHVRGGHSSMPLPHTGIGIAAEIIATLENNPYAPKLVPGSPLHHMYICRARYTPNEDSQVTKLVRSGDLDALAQLLAASGPALRFRMQTSQAVDIVQAGLKINAMPETVEIGVNYRVALHNSIAEVKQRTVQVLKPILDKYQVKLEAFGDGAYTYVPAPGIHAAYDVDYNATLVLTARSEAQAAPASPTAGGIWDLFSGTIRHTFAADGQTVVPVGDIMNGNTDTRHYLNLTRSIYRWIPMRMPWIKNFHAIDEGLHMEGHMETVRFYYNLIRNFDAADV